MTDKEFEASWAKAKEHDRIQAESFKKEMSKLSPKERKRIMEEAENTRLWEDWTEYN